LFAVGMLLLPMGYPRHLSPGGLISLVRIGLLFFCATSVFQESANVAISGSLVAGYPMRFMLLLNRENLLFLLVLDLVFFSVYSWASIDLLGRLRFALYLLLQLLIAPFLLSENLLVTAGLQLLLGGLMYHLLRSHQEAGALGNLIERASRQIYNYSTLLAVTVVTWGLIEHSGSLQLAPSGLGTIGPFFWGVLLFACAVPHLLSWFSRASMEFPRHLFVVVSGYMAGLLYKYVGWQSLLPSTNIQYPSLFLSLGGLICSILFLWRILSESDRQRIIAAYVSFLFSLVLLLAGIFGYSRSAPAMYLLLALPLLVAVLAVAKDIVIGSKRSLLSFGILFLLLVGFPGSPQYLTFSGLGARALQVGSFATLVFVLLWFLHLWSLFHWVRREVLSLTGAPGGSTMADRNETYALLFPLMVALVIVTQVAGRWI
jgi:hypothetical protein